MREEIRSKIGGNIRGIFNRAKEEFRVRTRDISDVVLDKIHNPTPRSELFPYRFYEDGIYYLEGDIGGFIFECTPLVGIDDNVYKQISMLFDDQLPTGGVIEVLLLASDDLSPIISKWENTGEEEQEIFKKLRKHRKEFFKSCNASKEDNFRHRNYKLYISYSNTISKRSPHEEIKKFKNRLGAILQGIGIGYGSVEPSVFLNLVKELVNYPDFGSATYREEDSLSDQICDVSNAMLVSDDGVLLSGGKYTNRVYEVTDYPKEGYTIGRLPNLLGDLDSDILQIPARFAIIYAISNEVTNTQQETYKKKGELVIKQANSNLDILNRGIKEEGIEWNEIIEKNIKQQERFLRSTFLVMLTAETGRIEQAEQSLKSLWRKNDFIIKPLRYFQLPGYLSFCPFLNKGELGKLMRRFSVKRTVLSSEPKALMPIHGEWKGSSKGGVILSGNRGQLFQWNNFEGGSNYNGVVIGESGSGKSVFLQELVMSHLAHGARVFVVDIGNSFEKTCKLLGGDFINFEMGSNISLNPFTNIPEEESYNPEKEEEEEKVNLAQDSLTSIKRIIAKMVAPISGTTDMQNALIARSLSKLWKKHKSMSNIDNLVEVLNQGDSRTRDLATLLFEFTTKGDFGRFFNKPSTIRFDKQLTVLEFDKLRETPELGAVIMQLLAIQIVQQVYLGDRKQPFVMLFDEAWYALDNFPLFLAALARTLRKYLGALILGTQSLGSFYGSSGKDAVRAEIDVARKGVIENSAWRVFLRQSGESSELLEKMKMPESLINTVRGLQTVPGKYSELLIYQSDKFYFTGKLMLDKFSQTLYSSSPRVFSSVRDYMEKQNLSVGAAVEAVMNEGIR